MVDGILRYVEEDSWEHGCLPNTSFSVSMDISFKGETKEDLINKIKEFFGVEDDDLELNSCGENGRIDVSVLEDFDGLKASESEIEQWQKGLIKLYSAIYTMNVYKLNEVVL